MNVFQLRFDQPDLERRYQRECGEFRAEYARTGYGFLVLFFGGIAALQVYFAEAPLVTNLVYAGLGLASLFAFSLCKSHNVPRRPEVLHRSLATVIMIGAVFAVFAPAGSSMLQLTAAAIGIVWFGVLAGLSFTWTWMMLALVVAPLLAVAMIAGRLMSSGHGLTLAALGLATGFTLLAVYVHERRGRSRYLQQHRPVQPVESLKGTSERVVHSDKSFQFIKELTIELSSISSTDEFYAGLLRYFKRAVQYRVAAVGRLQNERLVPVLVRTETGRDGSEDTVRQLWSRQLMGQLRQTRSAIAGDAEMGLLESDWRDDRIHFGHRMDIPFFSQGRLDGVVTLLRTAPAFTEAETALASALVFHGLFAHRSARLQQQLEKTRHRAVDQPRVSPPNTDAAESAGAVLPVDEFLRRANDAFEAARAAGQPVSLLLIELDQHEELTERYGAAAGNRVYEAVARLVAGHGVQEAILGHYGTGSFAMQLPLALNQAREVAERLRASIRRRPVKVGSQQISVSVSVGISARDSAADFLSLLRGADIGLYLARDGDGNSVRVHH